jgi:hypothetical protein
MTSPPSRAPDFYTVAKLSVACHPPTKQARLRARQKTINVP